MAIDAEKYLKRMDKAAKILGNQAYEMKARTLQAKISDYVCGFALNGNENKSMQITKRLIDGCEELMIVLGKIDDIRQQVKLAKKELRRSN